MIHALKISLPECRGRFKNKAPAEPEGAIQFENSDNYLQFEDSTDYLVFETE